MAAFPEISKIQFEGPGSKNPLAFRFYDENEIVEGKTMKEQLRFSVAYWHTMRGSGEAIVFQNWGWWVPAVSVVVWLLLNLLGYALAVRGLRREVY